MRTRSFGCSSTILAPAPVASELHWRRCRRRRRGDVAASVGFGRSWILVLLARGRLLSLSPAWRSLRGERKSHEERRF